MSCESSSHLYLTRGRFLGIFFKQNYCLLEHWYNKYGIESELSLKGAELELWLECTKLRLSLEKNGKISVTFSKTLQVFFRRNVNETLSIFIMWQVTEHFHYVTSHWAFPLCDNFVVFGLLFSSSPVKTFGLHLDQRFFVNYSSFASTTFFFICSASIAVLSCLYSTHRSLSSFWGSYLSITYYYLSEIMQTNT